MRIAPKAFVASGEVRLHPNHKGLGPPTDHLTGVLPPLLSVTAVRTSSFSIYQSAKYKYAKHFENITGESPLDVANARGRYPTMSTILCFGAAGATAGSIVTVLACASHFT